MNALVIPRGRSSENLLNGLSKNHLNLGHLRWYYILQGSLKLGQSSQGWPIPSEIQGHVDYLCFTRGSKWRIGDSWQMPDYSFDWNSYILKNTLQCRLIPVESVSRRELSPDLVLGSLSGWFVLLDSSCDLLSFFAMSRTLFVCAESSVILPVFALPFQTSGYSYLVCGNPNVWYS